jgi:hypothetical protein
MSGIETTGSVPKGLWPGVKSSFEAAGKKTANYHEMLFKKVSSDKKYEEYVQVVGHGIAQLKPEASPVQFASIRQGYTTRLVNATYALGTTVTFEEMKFNKFMKPAFTRTERLRNSLHQAKQIIAANIFDRSANATYTGGDGVTLLNTAHPMAAGGTWANRPTVDSALNEAALQDLLIQIRTNRADNGDINPLNGHQLVVAENNFFVGNQLVKNAKQPETFSNNENLIVTLGMLPGGCVANPYLQTANAWYITTNIDDGMIYQEAIGADIWEDNDSKTRDYQIMAAETYTLGWSNPRGVFGNFLI